MSRVTLTEDQVNVLVKAFLEREGWVNVVALKGNSTGVDVSGEDPHGRRKVEVESKGGTSGRTTSPRFGLAFDSAQVNCHVAEAVFKVLTYRDRSRSNTVLIALPDDEMHLSRVLPVSQTLKKLDIGLLAVSDAGVRVVSGAVDTR